MVKKQHFFGANLLKIAKNFAKKIYEKKNFLSKYGIMKNWRKKLKICSFFETPKTNGEDSGF